MRSVLVLAALFSSIAASAAEGQVALGSPSMAVASVARPQLGSCDANSGAASFDRIAACTRLIRMGNASGAVYVARASAYADSGDRSTAIADLSTAIALSPDNAAAYALRGALYLKDEEFRDGLVDLDRALTLAPDDEEALRTRAFAFDELGAYPAAIADYTALLALTRDDSYRYFRGFAYWHRGQDAFAVADFEAVMTSASPTLSAWGHRGRGLVHERAGAYGEALVDYTAALALDPSDDRAYAGRCRMQAATGGAAAAGCASAMMTAATP